MVTTSKVRNKMEYNEIIAYGEPGDWPKYPHAAGYKDSDTSKAAALKIEAKKLDKEILFHIRKYCFGVSPDQLASDLGMSILSIRPAFSRLKIKGLIADTGRRAKTEAGNNSKIMVAI